jgi:hypothetical protein
MSVVEIVRSFMPDVAVFVSGLLVNMFLCILWRRRVVHKRAFIERRKEFGTPESSVSLPTLSQEPQYYQVAAFESTQVASLAKPASDIPSMPKGDYDDIHGLFAAPIASESPHMLFLKIYWMLFLVVALAALFPSLLSSPFYIIAGIMITLYGSPASIRSPQHVM